MTHGRTWGAVALVALIASGAAHAEVQPPSADTRPAALRNVGLDQRLNEQVPLDVTFRDEAGQPVTIGALLRGKPVILTLAYYRCPMLCTLVLNGLVSSLRAIPFTLGQEFDVITVSIDPRDTPEVAAAKKRNYLDSYRRPGAEQGWHFLTGDEASIQRLAQAVGFRYQYDAERDEYAHAAGIMLLTPTGVLSRYFYGVEFAPRDVRLGLVEAGENKIGSPVDQMLLFCYRYDPTTARYSAAVMNLVRLGGISTVLAFAGFLLWSRRRERRGSDGTAAGMRTRTPRHARAAGTTRR